MAFQPSAFKISPPLLNSASPWATTIEDLGDIYNCPHTGAVTIRTSLLEGFCHDPVIHQYTFYNPSIGTASADTDLSSPSATRVSSINTLGYSPEPLQDYLRKLGCAARGKKGGFIPRLEKPIIVSITGTAEEVAQCYQLILKAQSESWRLSNHEQESNENREDGDDKGMGRLNLMMEINLSCPNIPDKPPPAYDAAALGQYLKSLAEVKGNAKERRDHAAEGGMVLCGIKTPPYTYTSQFQSLISALEASEAHPGGCPIAFITATNTLGSCLVLNDSDMTPAINSATGAGIGGMAGSAIHPLALGNVATIRKMLDASKKENIRAIKIIGVGGVSDKAGFERMTAVGAEAVAVGTALGRIGVGVFERIAKGSKG